MQKMTIKKMDVNHQLEALEERILLSADPLLTPVIFPSTASPDAVEVQVIESQPDTVENKAPGSDQDAFAGLAKLPLNRLVDPNDNLSVDDQLLESNSHDLVVEKGQTLTGNGSLQAHLTNNGAIGPGNSPGTVSVGSYTNNSELIIEIGGTGVGQFDQLNVTNSAQLGGKLTIKLIDGFKLKEGDSFKFLTFGSVQGNFASADGLFGFDDGSGYFQLKKSTDSLELVYRKLGNDLKIVFDNEGNSNDFGELLNSKYFSPTTDIKSVEGKVRLQYANFAQFEGTVKIDSIEAKDVVIATGLPNDIRAKVGDLANKIDSEFGGYIKDLGKDTEKISGVDMRGFQIAGVNMKAFVGVNGGFDESGQLSGSAKGIKIENMDFAYVDMKPTSPILNKLTNGFRALKAVAEASTTTNEKIETVGMGSYLKMSADKIILNINDGVTWPGDFGPPVIDFKTSFKAETSDKDNDGKIDPEGYEVKVGNESIYIDFDGNQRIEAALINGQVSLLNFVHAKGDFVFRKGPTSEVDIATGFPSDIKKVLGIVSHVDKRLVDYVKSLGDNYSMLENREVNGFELAGKNLKAFVGTGGGYGKDGKLADSAKGIEVESMEFAYVDMNPTDPLLAELTGGFRALEATGNKLNTTGMGDYLKLKADKIEVQINEGEAWPGDIGPPVIDFAHSFEAETEHKDKNGRAIDKDGDGKIDTEDGYEVKIDEEKSVYIDLDGNQRNEASLIEGRMSLAGFVHIGGNLVFRKGPTNSFNIATGLPADIAAKAHQVADAADGKFGDYVKTLGDKTKTLNSVEMSGFEIAGKDINAFVGVGGSFNDKGKLYTDSATGLKLEGLDFAYLDMTPTLPKINELLKNFRALHAEAKTVKLIGFEDHMKLEAKNIEVNLNMGPKWPGGFGPAVIDFAGSFAEEPVGVDRDGDGNKGEQAGYEVKIDKDKSVYIDHDGNERIEVSLNDAKLNILNFIVAEGNFSFLKGPTHTVKVNTGIPSNISKLGELANRLPKLPKLIEMEVDSLQFGGEDIHVFAGIGGSDFKNGKINSGATGVLIRDVDFAFAKFSSTLGGDTKLGDFLPEFQALSIEAKEGNFVGLGDRFKVEGVTVDINEGTPWVEGLDIAPTINFEASDFGDDKGYAVKTGSKLSDKILLDYDTSVLRIGVEKAKLDLMGVIEIEGGFVFEKGKTVNVKVNSRLEELKKVLVKTGVIDKEDIDKFKLSGDVDVMTLGLNNVTLTQDLGIAKATIKNVDAALFIATPTLAGLFPGGENHAPKFIALKAKGSGASVEVKEGAPVTISASKSIEVEANFTYFPGLDPKSQAAILASAAPAIDFASSFKDKHFKVDVANNAEPMKLDYAAQAFRLAIQHAEVAIANPVTKENVVLLSGGLAISRLSGQTVTLSDNRKIEDVDGITFVGKNLKASVKLGGIDQNLGADAEVGVALMRKGLVQSDYYLALKTELNLEASSAVDIPALPKLDGVKVKLKAIELNANIKVPGLVNDAKDLAVDTKDSGKAPNVTDVKDRVFAAIDFAKSYGGESTAGVDLDGNGRIDQTGLVLTTTNDDVVDSAVLLNYSAAFVGFRGQAVFTLDSLPGVKLVGTFDTVVSPDYTQVFFDGKLNVGYGSKALVLNAKGVMVNEFIKDEDGTITGHKFGIKLLTQGGFDVPGVVALNAGMEFRVNTSGEDISVELNEKFKAQLGYDTITIDKSPDKIDGSKGEAAAYFTLKAQGKLTLMDTFSINGSAVISGSANGELNFGVNGDINLPGLGELKATGNITLGVNGISTELNLEGKAKILDLIEIGGNFTFKLDTRAGSEEIRLTVADPTVKLWTLFTLAPGGSISLGFNNGVFKMASPITAGVDVAVIKGNVTLSKLDSLGNFEFDFGVKAGASVGGVGANAQAELTVKRSNDEFSLDSRLTGSGSVKISMPKFIPDINLSGSISGGLDLVHDPDSGTLSIGADVFGYDLSIPVPGLKLAFPNIPPANVASKSGGAVTVHVGSRSSERSFDKNVSDETIRISRVGNDLMIDVQGKVTLIKGGYSSINIDTGSGNDKVIISGSVDGQVNISNAETVSYSGKGTANISGTSGADNITLGGSGTSFVTAGAGDDLIKFNGAGHHTLTPGTGNDTIETNMSGGTLKLILADGFGNDQLDGSGKISHLDMSQIVDNINLEYDYHGEAFSMQSDAGSLALASTIVPLIDRIDFGYGHDEYVIVEANDIELTEAGGINTFYYVVKQDGNAYFNGDRFTLNGKTTVFDRGIDEFYFGHIDYNKKMENSRFDGVSSHSLNSGGKTLTMSCEGYDFGDAKVEINADNFNLDGAFSAAKWVIDTGSNVNFNAGLTATLGDIKFTQQDASGVVKIAADMIAKNGNIHLQASGDINQTAGSISTQAQDKTIQISATQGSVSQSDASHIKTNNTAIDITAKQNIDVANIDAGTAKVTLSASDGGIFDSGDTDIDIKAAELEFTANTGFGVDSNDIDTDVGDVSGKVTTGSINLQEENALNILAAGLQVTNDGNILVNNKQADISLNGDLRVGGAGHIRVKSDAGSIDIRADISTGSDKTISLQAKQGIKQQAGKSINTNKGTVDLWAQEGDIIQDDGAMITTGSQGKARLQAGGSIELAGISVGAGSVSIKTDNGSVMDAGDQDKDIHAGHLRMQAGSDIGQLGEGVNPLEIDVDVLTAHSATGGISLVEGDRIKVDSVGLSIERVNEDATTSTLTDTEQSDLITKANGDIVLQTTAGDIVVNDGVSTDDKGVHANGSGNILLQAKGAGTSIILNADVQSGSGDISVLAAKDITQTNTADITTVAGNIDMEASTGSVSQNTQARISTGDNSLGDIRVKANNNVTIGGLHAGLGNVSIIAETGKVNDADGHGSNHYKDVDAAGLRIDARQDIGALGAGVNPLEIAVDTLSAKSATGGIALLEENGITIDRVAVSVERVQADASSQTVTDGWQSDLVAGTNGDIVLQTTAGNIVVNDGVSTDDKGIHANGSGNILLQAKWRHRIQTTAGNIVVNDGVSTDDKGIHANGSGNILLQAKGAGTSIILNADVQSGSGDISVLAAKDITQTNTADITTVAGNIDMEASTGSVSQNTQARISTGDNSLGDIRVKANNNVTIGGLHAGLGNVSIIAETGKVNDADGHGSNHYKDVDAAGLRIDARQDIGALGAGVNPLEIAVDTLSAKSATGGIALLEENGITIDRVAVSVERVQADASSQTVTDGWQSDLVAGTNGDIVLQTTAGNIVVNDGVSTDDKGVHANGSGNILLQAKGAGTSIILNADVQSGSGDISVLAAKDITQTNTADITTVAGNIDMEASTGSVSQNTQARISTGDNSLGDIRVKANNNVTIGGLHAGLGNVSIIAETGKVNDADGHGSNHYKDVDAAGLRIDARQDIGALGAGVNPLEIAVDTLSAKSATGGIALLEENGITIDRVAVSVERVQADASSQTVTDGWQSDLVAGTNGDIVLQTTAGNIVVNDGVSTDDKGIHANGSGNILLQAKGAGTSIILNADVQSGSGDISVLAAKDITQTNTADITTVAGNVDIEASAGSVIQADGARATTGDAGGNIRVKANNNIAIGGLHAGTADVSVTTETGSITDSGDHYKDIRASKLRIDAGIGAGTENAIDTAVDTYAGRAGIGGLHLDEDDDIEINTLSAISIERVRADASTSSITDAPLSDLRTRDNGSISLETTDGTISIYDGQVPGDGIGIQAHGAGNIDIDARGAGQDVLIKEGTDIISGSGNIHILAEDAVLQEDQADINVSMDGNIEVKALTGSIYMTDGTQARTQGKGNIHYQAKVDVDLSRLVSQAHTTVIADTGQIRDNLQIGAGQVDYSKKIDPSAARTVNSKHTTVVKNGVDYYGNYKIGKLVGEQSNIESNSLSLLANKGIGLLGVQDLDTDVEQIEMINKTSNHIFVQEKDSINVTGQGARNFNAAGNLMFATITGQLTIDNKDIRQRHESYSTQGQQVAGYTIGGYILQDFYLDQGIRIVNDKMHTGKEGFLYVRGGIGDWGPMNYDQLADELSRNRNTQSHAITSGSEGAKGNTSIGAWAGNLFATNNKENAQNEKVSTDDAMKRYQLSMLGELGYDFTPNIGTTEHLDLEEVLALYVDEISDPVAGISDFDDALDPAAGNAETNEQKTENIAQQRLIHFFMEAIKRVYADQQLSIEELYAIYTKMADEHSVKVIDLATFTRLIEGRLA